ncbi:MAG: lysophospholipid acyltransferase family protein, partial [Candidatus Neomarinimicrobiota bacterium]
MNVLDNPKYSHLLKRQPFYHRIGKTLLYNWAKFIFSWYTPLSVFGKENIPNDSFIFCSNHNAHLDVIALSLSANKNFNNVGMLAAKDYWFDNAFRRNIMKPVMNLIPLGRKSHLGKDITFEQTLELSNSFMNVDKRCIIIFPEGTRGKPDVLKRFRKGPARLSIGTGKPILPAIVTGSGKSWPKGKFIFKPGKIHVYILEPIDPNSFTIGDKNNEKDLFKTAEAMTKELEEKIKSKLEELT